MAKRGIAKKAAEESAASRWILGVVLFGCIVAGIYSGEFNDRVAHLDTRGHLGATLIGYAFATVVATIILSILVWVTRAVTRLVNKRGAK